MSRFDLRAYHRALALYCLHQASSPATAGELAEVMGTLAQSEGHPKVCWVGISPASVSGHLRSLERDGHAKRHEAKPNGRHGREEPSWVRIGPKDPTVQLPDPGAIEADEPAAPSAAAKPAESDRYEGMSRDQLLAVLRINDEVAGAAARFMHEMREIAERGRRTLIAAGLELG